jgi:Methyltransferase domain
MTLRVQKRLPFLRPLLVRRGMADFPQGVEYGDVVKGLPVTPGSARAVYSSHVLEHLALEEFRQALRNVYGYLEPGGVFRLVVPDLELRARQYLTASDAEAGTRFVRSLYMGTESKGSLTSALKLTLSRAAHLWMWDEKGLKAELEKAGFADVRRAEFGDNPDPAFHDVESPDRWTENLGMECRKPALLLEEVGDQVLAVVGEH